LIQAFCHHCVLLEQGRIVAAGEPTNVITTYQERIAEEMKTQGRKKEKGLESESPDIETCRIIAVNIKTENNSPIASGRSLTIEIELGVSEALDGLACAIDIGNAELTSITTLVYGYPEGRITLSPPFTTMRCYIDRLPLAPGNYDLRFSFFVPASATTLVTQGWDDGGVAMKVVAEDISWGIIMRQKQNFVHVPAKWELVTGQSNQDCDSRLITRLTD
jgi:hypothetical protein